MSVLDTTGPRSGKYDNLEAVQGAFVLDSAKVYYSASLSSSVDIFASKTNKYAETELVEIVCADKGVCVRFGGDDVAAADATKDWCIPANSSKIFVVDPDKRYLRIIELAATAKVWVREII
jgi:hypothetical protein